MFGIPPFYLGHLGRVPVYVLPEAIFTLLMVASFSSGVTDFLIMAVVVLSTILIHEFGHAVVAGLAGMGGVTILVGALGGLCIYQGTPDPRRQIAISLAGPGLNLSVVALLYGLALAIPSWIHWDPLLQSFLANLFAVNLLVGLFNLLPIYPLDGGQATLGTVTWISGRPTVARKITLTVAFIVAPCALGALTFLRGGQPPLFTLIIVGLLLFQAWRDLR